jgi:hypothetical protein
MFNDLAIQKIKLFTYYTNKNITYSPTIRNAGSGMLAASKNREE